MNYKNILPIFAFIAIMLSSCDDQIMEWDEDPSHGEVTLAELPLELAEQISRYDALNTYTDFTLGVGLGLDLYMSDETFRTIANENFDEITIGYAMKHGPMVQSDGTLDFEAADGFMTVAKEAGLSVFGHTLMWHSNQNASYLNGIIAPTVIPASGGSNALDIAGLQDGSFTNWNPANPGDGITVEDGKGLSSEAKAVQLIAGADAANPWNLQLLTPDIIIDSSSSYEVSFYIKSDQPGKGRISFGGLENNYPWKDWYGTGGDWTEAFETTTEWQQVKFTVDDFTGTSFTMAFDLGYLPGVTYFMDVENIKVVDPNAESGVVNMIGNGDFEAGIDGWGKWNGSDNALSHSTTEVFEGTGAMKVLNETSNEGGQWKTQIHSDFTSVLTADETYTVSFMVRSDDAGSVRCSTTGGDAHYQGDVVTSTTWTLVEWEITAHGEEAGLNFDLGLIAGTYYIDNVVVSNGDTGGSSEPTLIEKTPEEKATIIGDAMETWISGMVGHYKDEIKAWDVVNEPIKDGNSGEVRDGNVEEPADDHFYWVKYLGKDYAVTAFNLARQYGNANDILFINDYNLESNLDKCQGLIDYVTYIEGQGATIDGIGTQMHISATSDTASIVQMFQMLGATGKLIKVSELDVRLGTNSPTLEQMAAQSEMYRFVIDMYKKYIPLAQQYGITIWGISDNTQEHEYWLPDESPNLWDANYNRKHAYKGVADGLAGKDISDDFTGELVY